MCNDYGNHVPYSAYLAAFSQLKVRLFATGGAPNLEQRDDIWPTDTAPVIRAIDGGAELVQLRWGFPPGRPQGPPVINMRSEGRRFARGRCLIPVSQPVEEGSAAFTMLTCEPGPDVAPIHNRQIVVVDKTDWIRWLDPETAEKEVLRPSVAGSLSVERVERAQR